jgi:hypothetical protein
MEKLNTEINQYSPTRKWQMEFREGYKLQGKSKIESPT